MDELNNSNPEITRTNSVFDSYSQQRRVSGDNDGMRSFFEDPSFQGGVLSSDVGSQATELTQVRLGGSIATEDSESSNAKFPKIEEIPVGVLCVLVLATLIALWGVPELFAFIRRKHPEWNLPDVKNRYKMRHSPYILDGSLLRPCTKVESTLLSEFIWDRVAFDTKKNRVVRLDKAKIDAHAFIISFEGDSGIFTLVSIIGDTLLFQNTLGVIKYLRCPTTDELEMMRIAEGVNRG